MTSGVHKVTADVGGRPCREVHQRGPMLCQGGDEAP